MKINHLKLSWSISKGRETYGYNICRLDSNKSGTRYRCSGGGYDMVGTVFAQFLQSEYQDKLLQIQCKAYHVYSEKFGFIQNKQALGDGERLYGMTYNQKTTKVELDGGCGLESMITIAKAIGLEVEREWNKRANRGYGATVGFYVTESGV